MFTGCGFHDEVGIRRFSVDGGGDTAIGQTSYVAVEESDFFVLFVFNSKLILLEMLYLHQN